MGYYDAVEIPLVELGIQRTGIRRNFQTVRRQFSGIYVTCSYWRIGNFVIVV